MAGVLAACLLVVAAAADPWAEEESRPPEPTDGSTSQAPAATAQAAAEARQLELLCGAAAPKLVPLPAVGSGSPARYLLRRFGVVDVDPKARDAVAVAERALVRLDASRAGATHPVACGWLDPGLGYVPEQPSRMERADHVVASLFGLPSHGEESEAFSELRRKRETELVTSQAVDTYLVDVLRLDDLRAALIAFADADEAARPKPAKEKGGAVDRARTGATQALKRVATARGLLGAACAAEKLDALQAAACKRLPQVGEQLTSATEALAKGAKEAREAAKAFGEWPSDPEPYCRTVASVRWYAASDQPRLLARFEVPLGRTPGLGVVAFGEGSARVVDVPAQPTYDVLVVNVPTASPFSAITEKGDAIPTDAEVAARFLTYLVRAAVPTLGKATIVPELEKGPPVSRCDATIRADPAAGPLASHTTRVVRAAINPEFQNTVYVCASKECDPKKEPQNVRNRLEVRLERGWHAVIVAEVAATAPAGAHRFETPRYVPIGGTSGPDQLFVLRGASQGEKAASVSLLLGAQRRAGIVAIGPSFVLGRSAAVFEQLNFRLGVELTKGISITFGPSLRFVKKAMDHEQGDVISVARDATGQATAPALRTEPRVEWGWSLGIGLDLGALGGAGDDLLKSMGVGK